MTELCPICRGRGEVEAGITTGFVRTGQDERGQPLGYPTKVVVNPWAVGKDGEIWMLQKNSSVPLWGIAVCGQCHGAGELWVKS